MSKTRKFIAFNSSFFLALALLTLLVVPDRLDLVGCCLGLSAFFGTQANYFRIKEAEK